MNPGSIQSVLVSVVLVLVIGFGIIFWLGGWAKQEQDKKQRERQRLRHLLVEYKEWWEKDSALGKQIGNVLTHKSELPIFDDNSIESLELNIARLRLEIDREYERSNFLQIDAEVSHLSQERDELEAKLYSHPEYEATENRRKEKFRKELMARRDARFGDKQ
jgi:hypothetical protein